MRPPICAVCEQAFDPQSGDCLRFKNYTALPKNITGHPDGTEWFCESHLQSAKELTELDLESALAILRAS